MRTPANSAKELETELAKAGRQLNTKGRPKHATVERHPSEIRMRPELFQPREFSFGLRETDQDHVKKLARIISIQGELDPIAVIKLGAKFVCVDGHDRLAASGLPRAANCIRPKSRMTPTPQASSRGDEKTSGGGPPLKRVLSYDAALSGLRR
jgi:hypothetical protein